MRIRRTRLLGLVTLASALGFAVPAGATPIGGTLYYTTFSGGTNVHSVDYSYNGSSLSLTNNQGVASTNGADGLLFAPDGHLIVAGQGSGQLHEITTTGSPVASINSGTGAYHMALSSSASDATLYTLWNGFGGGGSSSIAGATLASGGLSGNGTAYSVSCAVNTTCNTDVRSLTYDSANHVWYYGTAGDGAAGTLGTVLFDDTAHTATLTQVLSGVYAHGLTFDAFTNNVILNSANFIQQFDPTSNLIVSTASGSGDQFDQAAVDGQGHLFVASNTGNLMFIDYATSGLIGAGGNFSSEQFLASSLDDIAPLSGAGACTGAACGTVPEPSVLALFGLGLPGLMWMRRRKAAN